MEVQIFIKLASKHQGVTDPRTLKSIIKHEGGPLNLTAELGNVPRACKVVGFSRDTFYRYQMAIETGGMGALIQSRHSQMNGISDAIS